MADQQITRSERTDPVRAERVVVRRDATRRDAMRRRLAAPDARGPEAAANADPALAAKARLRLAGVRLEAAFELKPHFQATAQVVGAAQAPAAGRRLRHRPAFPASLDDAGVVAAVQHRVCSRGRRRDDERYGHERAGATASEPAGPHRHPARRGRNGRRCRDSRRPYARRHRHAPKSIPVAAAERASIVVLRWRAVSRAAPTTRRPVAASAPGRSQDEAAHERRHMGRHRRVAKISGDCTSNLDDPGPQDLPTAAAPDPIDDALADFVRHECLRRSNDAATQPGSGTRALRRSPCSQACRGAVHPASQRAMDRIVPLFLVLPRGSSCAARPRPCAAQPAPHGAATRPHG